MQTMQTSRIAKEMIRLQETFIDHSFYVADFMQDQTGRMASALLSRSGFMNGNGVDAVKESIRLSRNMRSGLKSSVKKGLTDLKTIIH